MAITLQINALLIKCPIPCPFPPGRGGVVNRLSENVILAKASARAQPEGQNPDHHIPHLWIPYQVRNDDNMDFLFSDSL